MKTAIVYLYDRLAGRLTEDENGFTFLYDPDFLASDGAEAVSLTLPLTDKPYHDTVLFPFSTDLFLRMAPQHCREELEDKPARPHVAASCLLQGLHRGCERGAGT